MDIRAKLQRFGRRTILLEELASVLNTVLSDVKSLHAEVQELCEQRVIEPVIKNTGF